MVTPVGKDFLKPQISEIHKVKENWSWFLILGILLIVLGIIAVSASVYTTMVTVVLLGCLLAVGGIAELVYSFWSKNWSGFFLALVVGLLYLIIGLIFIFKPVQSAAALTLLIGALFVVGGLFKIITSIFVRFEHWGWLLFSGIISLILGILVLAEWPLSSLWIIGLFVGIDLIFMGWTSVVFALTVKRLQELRKQ